MNRLKIKQQYFFTFLLSLAFLTAQAQYDEVVPISRDSAWTTGGNVGVFFQQTALNNWAGGGDGAVAYGAELNLFANKRRRNHTWFNNIQAGYGLVNIEGEGSRKNNDVLIVTSQYGRYLTKKWQLTGGIDFRTQFDDGFDYEQAVDGTDTLISAFMAPGYLSPYLGFAYKPNDDFTATLSPIMEKITFVLDDELSAIGAYGVDPGENYLLQTGFSLNVQYQKEIMTNVNLKTNLLMFTAYKEPEHVDVNFDLFLNFKINDYLTTNFTLQTIYDHDVDIEAEDGTSGPKLQLRNVLNVGVTLQLGEKKIEE